jgi:hypothetical protein
MDHLHTKNCGCHQCAEDPTLRKIATISALVHSGPMKKLQDELRPEKVRMLHCYCHSLHTKAQHARGEIHKNYVSAAVAAAAATKSAASSEAARTSRALISEIAKTAQENTQRSRKRAASDFQYETRDNKRVKSQGDEPDVDSIAS